MFIKGPLHEPILWSNSVIQYCDHIIGSCIHSFIYVIIESTKMWRKLDGMLVEYEHLPLRVFYCLKIGSKVRKKSNQFDFFLRHSIFFKGRRRVCRVFFVYLCGMSHLAVEWTNQCRVIQSNGEITKHASTLSVQYLWEYGTGQWDTSPPFVFFPFVLQTLEICAILSQR